MNTLEISQSTLIRIKKQAKKLKNASSLTLSKAKDEIAVKKGFKSYNHAKKMFDNFESLPPIYVAIRRNDFSTSFYMNSCHYTNNKTLDVDDETRKKLIEIINKKFALYNVSPGDEYYFCKLSSLRIDLDMEREAHKKEIERRNLMSIGMPGHFHQSHFLYEIEISLSDYFYSILGFNDDIFIEPSYFIIENKLLQAIDIDNEEHTEHTMTADFYD